MGGPARLIINGAPKKKLEVGAAALQVRTLLEALEARYSRYRPDSIVSVINQRAGSGMFTEDIETQALLDLAGQLWDASGGLLISLRGRSGGLGTFERTVMLTPPRSSQHAYWWAGKRSSGGHRAPFADPGHGDRSGRTCQRVCSRQCYQLDAGLNVASALIELAGDVATIGDSEDGTPWRVGIQNPDGVGSLCTVQLSNAAVATSGNYARWVDYEGKQ